MNSNKRSIPLSNQHIQNNLMSSIKNPNKSQLNINSNRVIIKDSNFPSKQLRLNNSYNSFYYNNGNNSDSKVHNYKTIIKKKKTPLLSSGTLVPSSRSKKYNCVFKNGIKIRNIDINDDCEDIKNEDTESLSTNAINKKKNNLSSKNAMNSGSPYLSNKTQSQFGSIIEPNSMGISTTQVSEPPKMNIFAEFINKILDKINPNINKRDRQFDPYNAQIQQPKTYIGELNIEPNDKINQNSNLNNQLNNVITKKQTDDNNIGNNTPKKNDLFTHSLKQLKQSPKESIQIKQQTDIIHKNSSIAPIKNNTIEPSLALYNNHIKSPNNNPTKILPVSNKNNIKGSIVSEMPLANVQIENNESSYIVLNIKKPPNNIKKEDDIKSRKSESKSSNNKFPFQPLKDILHSPISKKSTNLTNTNTNTNTNNYIDPPTNENLISHLGEHLQKEIHPLPINEDIINNQKGGKGFRSCSELTQAGREADGTIKIDQDTPLINLSVGGIVGFNMFGVLDGHGPHGHYISQYCKDYFIKNMINYTLLLKMSKGIKTSEEIYIELKNNRFEYIIELFNQFDIELSKQNVIDYTISGTTCNIIFQFNKHLICFSVGDSRSILIYDKGDYSNQGILALSTDHKPNLPGEIERIQLYGGEVDTMKDIYGNNIGPARVYKLGFDSPGLAMSRSLGDFQAKEVGVIPTPQIIEYDINATTKFLVVCSDGVWEFMTNEQVRDIGNIFYARNDVANFCTELVKYSMILWEQFGLNRDDITVVSVFF